MSFLLKQTVDYAVFGYGSLEITPMDSLASGLALLSELLVLSPVSCRGLRGYWYYRELAG